MGMRRLPIDPDTVAKGLTAFQAVDAVGAATVPIIRRDLERLGCPRWLRNTIPVLKAASAVGLLVGRREPRLGRLTTDALVVYFVGALGAHARVRDEAWRYAAAAGMLGVTVVARQAYRDGEGEPSVAVDVAADAELVDLTEAGAPEGSARRTSAPS